MSALFRYVTCSYPHHPSRYMRTYIAMHLLTGHCQGSTDLVIAANKSVLCRVLGAGVHDDQLVQLPLHDDLELFTHFNFHAVLQPHGRNVEVGHLTLKGGRFGFRNLNVFHSLRDVQCLGEGGSENSSVNACLNTEEGRQQRV